MGRTSKNAKPFKMNCLQCNTRISTSKRSGLCGPCRTVRKCQTYRRKHREQDNARQAVWRKANPEKVKAIQARWMAANRVEKNARKRRRDAELKSLIYEYYGRFCACCGETENSFLVIDHINNDGCQKRKLHGIGTTFYRWIARNGFPDYLQILCSNCNQSKRMNGGICVHQKN